MVEQTVNDQNADGSGGLTKLVMVFSTDPRIESMPITLNFPPFAFQREDYELFRTGAEYVKTTLGMYHRINDVAKMQKVSPRPTITETTITVRELTYRKE